MANTKEKAKVSVATTVTTISTSNPEVVVLKPAIQKQVNQLRAGRDLAKQAKEMSDNAREVILNAIGSITSNLIGTDAKGKRLVSIKLIESSEKIDFERMEKENPELYSLVQTYKVAKGAGTPTVRVDIL